MFPVRPDRTGRVFQAGFRAVSLAAALEAAVSLAEGFQGAEYLPAVEEVVFLEVAFRRAGSLLASVEDLAARLISRQVAQVIFRPAVTSPSIRPSRASPAGLVATLFKTTARACS